MSVSKRFYNAVSQMSSIGVHDTVPVHLFTAIENDQGTVSCNFEAKLVVLNLTDSRDVEKVLTLAAVALDEMLALETGTLVYDIRTNPSVEGTPADTALRTVVLESGVLTRLAVLGRLEGTSVLAKSVQDLLYATKVETHQLQTFAELERVLDDVGPALSLARSAQAHMPDFAANYGGSFFSVPELNATVLRTSGNGVNPEYFQRMFRAALCTHVRNKASTLILDTSDSPLITDAGQFESFTRNVISPMAALGIASTLVHVRLDEVGQAPGAVPVDVTCAEWGVFACEASTLGEAYTLVRALRGCTVKTAPAVPGAVFAQT